VTSYFQVGGTFENEFCRDVEVRPPQESAAAPRTGLPATNVDFEHSRNFAALLDSIGCSIVVSTYQAGKVFTIGTHGGELQIRFHHFEQAMGITRTPTGLAIGSKRQVWTLRAAPAELADRIRPASTHDVAFLARQAHFTGPVLGHDLAWAGNRLWLVNTLFNCLATLEPESSFVPQWRPPFITEIAMGDRCHLNGLAADAQGPRYVTALGETDVVDGWRPGKRDGGCLIDVAGGEVIVRGLSMPHSPRLAQGELWLLNSGYGRLERVDVAGRKSVPVAALPGYGRGLDLFGGLAFVGLSRVRETAVFGGIPLDEHRKSLRCGVAVVDCRSGAIVGTLFFNTGVEEIFDVTVLPGYRNPVLSGPYPDIDDMETVWLVPAPQNARPAGGPIQPDPAPSALPAPPGSAAVV